MYYCAIVFVRTDEKLDCSEVFRNRHLVVLIHDDHKAAIFMIIEGCNVTGTVLELQVYYPHRAIPDHNNKWR
jgi:hypothetical protein